MDPRLDLIRHYRWLRRYGLNDSHSGNISLRSADAYWISPSGACADTLEAEQLLRCRLDAEPAAGASLDAPLHRLVYVKNPNAGAVLHSHGAYSVAVTLSGEDFVPLDFEGQYYFPESRYWISPTRITWPMRPNGYPMPWPNFRWPWCAATAYTPVRLTLIWPISGPVLSSCRQKPACSPGWREQFEFTAAPLAPSPSGGCCKRF